MDCGGTQHQKLAVWCNHPESAWALAAANCTDGYIYQLKPTYVNHSFWTTISIWFVNQSIQCRCVCIHAHTGSHESGAALWITSAAVFCNRLQSPILNLTHSLFIHKRERQTEGGRGWRNGGEWKLLRLSDVTDVEEDRGQHKGNAQKGEQEGEHAQNRGMKQKASAEKKTSMFFLYRPELEL